MRVRIILVEPHEAGNVGAAARAMKNFGFRDLWVAGTRAQRLDDISEWWAKGAMDVLQSIRRVDTLAEALAGVHLSVATTAVRGRHVFERLTPVELARLAEETLGDEHTLGIVFGREESGLTGAEIALCQRTASIPTAPDYETMNLAQSVAVFCYELGKGLVSRAKEPDPAPGRLVHGLETRTRALLERINFFGDKSPERMCAELQALAGRSHLSTREASMLLSLVAHVEKALASQSREP
ncbi:MAG TPA: RNA methyltransferase [Thermoanaerobaculia bacterium]|nr:RNA methyltransferase [Thermoanaerobaculia bacterium]